MSEENGGVANYVSVDSVHGSYGYRQHSMSLRFPDDLQRYQLGSGKQLRQLNSKLMMNIVTFFYDFHVIASELTTVLRSLVNGID